MSASTRRPWIVGNWKLFHGVGESVRVVSELASRFPSGWPCDVGIAPTFLSITAVRDAVAGKGIAVGAQDVYWEKEGAFTGEVSAALLRDAGCAFCIVGHSERRQYFGETDAWVRRKTKAVLDAQMTPIVCIGETLEEREAGSTLDVVLRQLTEALDGLTHDEIAQLTIAYEPVWAIGTGRTARPEDAQAVQRAIRGRLSDRSTAAIADAVRVIYGGSVKPDNAASLFREPDIDGALVGGASLKADSFAAIVAASI